MKEPKKLEPCTPEFEDAFRDGFGGCRMTCDCGRECFDVANTYDWGEGELEGLKVRADKEPDKYVPLDYSCSGLTVNGKTFVLGCPCNGARRYQDWIDQHDVKLARYLNARCRLLTEQAEALRVFAVLADDSDLLAAAKMALAWATGQGRYSAGQDTIQTLAEEVAPALEQAIKRTEERK